MKPFRALLSIAVATPLLLLAFNQLSAPEPSPEACDTEVDLRQAGQVLEGYPQGHQGFGRTNLCGFYSAATLMDAWRIKADLRPEAGAGQRINPVALAVELARDRNWPIWMPLQNTTDGLNNRKGRWGSIVCSVVDYAREKGACADRGFDVMNWREQGEYADKNIQLYDLLYAYGRKSESERARELDAVAEKVQTIHRSSSLADVKDLIRKNDRHPYRTIDALLHQNCKDQRVPPEDVPRCQSAYYSGLDFFGIQLKEDPLRTHRALQKIHSLLDVPKPLPVSIAYCSKVMREGRSFASRSLLMKGCSPHWALVIGRKKVNGQCHLLIRNTSKPDVPYSTDWIQDGMDVWIDAEFLQRTIYSVQWLDDPKSASSLVVRH